MRELVVDALDRDLSRDHPNIVTFSGGVDSSIVAALGASLDRRIETVSMLPTLDFEHPQATLDQVDDFHRQVKLAAHWPYHIDEHGWVDALLSSPAVRVPMMHPALVFAALKGAERGARVVAGGEYADELFGGWNTLYKAWVASLSGRDLLTTLARRSGPIRLKAARVWLVPRILRRHTRLCFPTELPGFIRSDLRAEYADYVSQARAEFRALAHPRRFLLQQLVRSNGWLMQNWEIFSEVSMRRSMPFYSREAIELAMASHPRDLAWPPKKLMREAFDNLVPASHLHRVGKDADGVSPRSAQPFSFSEPLPPAAMDLFEPGAITPHGPFTPDDAAAIAPLFTVLRQPAACGLPITNERR